MSHFDERQWKTEIRAFRFAMTSGYFNAADRELLRAAIANREMKLLEINDPEETRVHNL
jgi:hypothetical protein